MKKYSQETVVGIFVAIGLICVGYMTVKLGNVGFLSDSNYTLYARFTSVSGLRVGNPVEMFGMEIGHVHGLRMDQESQAAAVEMKIHKGIKIFDDAIASIKTSGLIGDKYIDIDPGGSDDLLKSGGTVTDTESPVDIIELVSKYAFGDVNTDSN